MTAPPRRPGMKPGMKGKKKPYMRRLFHRPPRTLWIVEPSYPIAAHYTTVSKMTSHGQFGTTYQYKRRIDGKLFAVKRIRKSSLYRLGPTSTQRQAWLMSMKAEIDILRRLRHKYMFSIEACYGDKHTLYCVMEHYVGHTLFDRLTEIGTFQETDAKPIIKMTLTALHYMHEYHRVIHGNLSPHHIIFHEQRIKVIGFGMSKIVLRLQSQRCLGDTAYYISPEAIRGDYGHLNDMWSVGVILFLMLFGYQPFWKNNNECFGQKQNKEICESVLKGYEEQKQRLVVETEYLIFGFIRAQQNELNVFHGQNTFYTIAPLIVHLIVAFYNDPISDEAYDFMNDLMERDVAKRLTASEALQHPWLVQGETRLTLLDEGVGNVPHARSEFIALSLFRCIVSDLFADHFDELKAEQFVFLKEMFIQYDANDEGMIEFKEFKEVLLEANILGLKEEQITDAFRKLDGRKISKINYECLINALIHDYVVATDHRLYEAFRDMDDDEDGKIKIEQLISKTVQINIYGKAHQILASIDWKELDSDGLVDYEAFLRILHPEFSEIPTWFTDV